MAKGKLKELYNKVRIGIIIKIISGIFALIEIVLCIEFGICLILEKQYIYGIILIVFGAIPVLMINAILYGFGQLIDNTDLIVRSKNLNKEISYVKPIEKEEPVIQEPIKQEEVYQEVKTEEIVQEPIKQEVKETPVEKRPNREKEILDSLKKKPSKKVEDDVKEYYSSEVNIYDNMVLFNDRTSVEVDDIKNLKCKGKFISFTANNDLYRIEYLSSDEASNNFKSYQPNTEVSIYWDDSLIKNNIMYYRGKEINVSKKKKLKVEGNTAKFIVDGITYNIEFFNGNEIEEFKKAIGMK